MVLRNGWSLIRLVFNEGFHCTFTYVKHVSDRGCTVCDRFDEAVECLKKEIGYFAEVENYAHLRKVVMGVILIHLHQEDYVAADHFFRDALR